MDMTVVVVYTSFEVGWLGSLSWDIAGVGCWIFVAGLSLRWHLLLISRSCRLLVLSQVDRLSVRVFNPRGSVNKSSFCARCSNKADWCSDHNRRGTRYNDMLILSTKMPWASYRGRWIRIETSLSVKILCDLSLSYLVVVMSGYQRGLSRCRRSLRIVWGDTWH